MKKKIQILLALFLLAGCAAPSGQETAVNTESPVSEETPAPAVPSAEAGSEIESVNEKIHQFD